MTIQGLLNTNHYATINRDGEEIQVKKNWVPFLYYVQKTESNSYGAQFYTVAPKKSRNIDTRLIWYICCMITKIPSLYNIIEITSETALTNESVVCYFSSICTLIFLLIKKVGTR